MDEDKRVSKIKRVDEMLRTNEWEPAGMDHMSGQKDGHANVHETESEPDSESDFEPEPCKVLKLSRARARWMKMNRRKQGRTGVGRMALRRMDPGRTEPGWNNPGWPQPASRRNSQDVQSAGPDSAWDDSDFRLTEAERTWVIMGALKSALLIGFIYVVVGGIFIRLMLHFW